MRSFLGWNSKQLQETQEYLVINDEKIGNPLFCKTFLEDISMFGEYDDLEYRIQTNLKAKDTVELYTFMLERMEVDYDPNLEGLVESFVCLLWGAAK